jgi:hypothetical protein
LSNRSVFTVGGFAAVTALTIGPAFDSSLHVRANLFTVVGNMVTVLTCGVHPGGKVDKRGELLIRHLLSALNGLNKLPLAETSASIEV